MSSIQLLDKTRKIGRLLHNSSSSKVVFNDICEVLGETLRANVLVISKKGKVLGVGVRDGIPLLSNLIENKVGTFADPQLCERFLSVLSTKENVNLDTLGFDQRANYPYKALISPIEIAGERLGTLFIYKLGDEFEIDDIILCEYGTTVVGLEMLRSVHEESTDEMRGRSVVRSAISTLSQSELEAINSIFKQLGGLSEGVLVASKIADSIGITRSVIVNALRKFESAGVIESRSSGMKGTFIRVMNEYVYEELETFNKENRAGRKN